MTDPEMARLLEDLEDRYAELFLLMEQSLSIDPGEAGKDDPLAILNAEIATRMQTLDARMRQLRTVAAQRRDRRREDGADPEMDRFLALLEKGLHALGGRLENRMEELRQTQVEVADALRNLVKGRQRVGQYRTPGGEGSQLDSQV